MTRKLPSSKSPLAGLLPAGPRSRRLRLAAGAVVLLLPITAQADQFVLFDATFTYTWDDAMNAKPSKSHYYVNEANWLNKARPVNWMSPVNYRDGKVHIRAEVLEKPAGDQTAGWALCYVANMGEYGCPYTDYYTKTGVYERDVDMRTFYNNATIQWDKGVKQVDLVYTIDGSGSGHVTNFPDKKDLVTPTKVRITMIQVSSGGTYDPGWIGQPDAGPARDSGTINDGAVRDVAEGGTRLDGGGGAGGSGTGGGSGMGGSGGGGGSAGTPGTGGVTGGGGTTGSGGSTGTTGVGGTMGVGGTAGIAGNGGTAGSAGGGGSGNGAPDGGGASGMDDAGGPRGSSEPESLGCDCSLKSGPRPWKAGPAALWALSLLRFRRRRARLARAALPLHHG
jgi:hypothetical protein